ncbi:MAG: 5-methyltetrahydropteroyltriglutamate--homocysteine S-methyltransferase [Elusimicrobia bacterium]|nr:5-methyltetrahydropteroyltriglutamate--homocysteine S-methyltransferase [Elusimicrobiota bacterium]
MALATNLGYPRIGVQRGLKKALEAFWAGKTSSNDLLETARAIRKANWLLQKEAGIAHIPSNDFSFYDHVLDTACVVGAIPKRFGQVSGSVDLQTYSTMARGSQSVTAMEMTKWFDTNYHYIVPELAVNQDFWLASRKPVEEYLEAKALGVETRPVILGPVSFLLLAKSQDADFNRLTLLDRLLPVYEELLAELVKAGAEWVQMDEPCLVLDLDAAALSAYKKAYAMLGGISPKLKILLTTYFGNLDKNMDAVLKLPVAGLHLDLVRAPEQLAKAVSKAPAKMVLSLGVIDGRNIWRADLAGALALVEPAVKKLGQDRVLIGPSCSFLHSPIDLEAETKLDREMKSWLAFAKQKLGEIAAVARAASKGRRAVAAALEDCRKAMRAKKTSPRIVNPAVRKRLAKATKTMAKRKSPYAKRIKLQNKHLGLPHFPTTTIGSLPQTPEVRANRASYKAGRIDRAAYENFIKEETKRAVLWQEEIGVDVLVHGEFERNDMVEYFGEQLKGFAFTENGWVQSYGSRCVKPPIIYGDVSRPDPMTVRWSRYAQSLSSRPVKGMLTGPVTILQWSFVRNDQPRSTTCRQVALAIRDEVVDLEAAGIKVIQIDEPALREGLPLRKKDRKSYLKWGVEAFRFSSCGVKDETQIHTHMCYCEFGDIPEAIAALDADVISMEASRSKMELLDSFRKFRYPNGIGPGVYDIHSPRVPSKEEMESLLMKALDVFNKEQLWVNPDCGLKTRRWEEVRPSVAAMVAAAKSLRKKINSHAGAAV